MKQIQIVLAALLMPLIVMTSLSISYAQEDVETAAWDGQSRFTVLVLGMDRRPNARDTLRVRTDTILLISIDPQNEQIGILHIPRDVHFAPPYTGIFSRVNTLLIEGENHQEGYGPYYLMDTLEYNMGLYIDRYIAFDFEAFIDVIDALGGIKITTTYTINDPTFPDMNYGFDPFYLPAGTHMLTGYDALRFARTRHNDTDVLRGQRQMQVMMAIYDRIQSTSGAGDLLLKAPQLYTSLQNHIYTDLKLNDMIQLVTYTLSIPPENMRTGSLDNQYTMYYALEDGRKVHIPDHSTILELMMATFGEKYTE